MSEIQHGGHQQGAQAYHGHGSVPTGETTPAPAHKKQVKDSTLQKDVQETALAADTKAQGHSHAVASSFRYATLSQQQLDGADPQHPQLSDSQATGNAPPTGPAGTGNPFFKANPMTTFFTVFAKLEQTMDEMIRVATKVTLMQMQGIKDTGLAQANATLQAGKAQATADRQQAYVSFAQAGLSLGMLAHSVGTDVGMGKMSTKAMQQTQKEAQKMEEGTGDLESEQAELEGKLSATKKNLNPKDPQFKVQQQKLEEADKMDQPALQDKITQAKKTREEANAKLEKDQEDLENMDVTQVKANEITQQRQKVKESLIAKKQAVDDEEFYTQKFDNFGKSPEKVQQKLQKRQAELQSNLLKNSGLTTKMRQKTDQTWQHADEYKMSGTNLKAWERRASLKQQDPWHMRLQLFQQVANSSLDGLKSLFKATGDEQYAYWQSEGQIMATYNQMIKTSLDSTISMSRDAYQMGGDIAQTLNHMADQETQSMHWAA